MPFISKNTMNGDEVKWLKMSDMYASAEHLNIWVIYARNKKMIARVKRKTNINKYENTFECLTTSQQNLYLPLDTRTRRNAK